MSFIQRARRRLRRLIANDEFSRLQQAVVELNGASELKKIFGWHIDPILDDPSIYEFDHIEDVNERRVRDAEAIGIVVRNTKPAVCVDIGTGEGHSAALMAVNAPQAKVLTINIPPEEILAGEGGKFTTVALERERIGSYFRERDLRNVTQIMVNSMLWEPDEVTIDVAFVDGCHDTQFVYDDTCKLLAQMEPGSFVLWHDFDLTMTGKYEWVHSVCSGVQRLLADGWLRGPLLHIRDSWVGIYRVGWDQLR